MRKKNKLANYKKNALVLIASLGVIILLGSSLGIFSNMLNVDENIDDNKPPLTKKSVLPKISSLESYWDNLETENLLNDKTSLTNFVNENGAIFQNLIASNKYEATAALNQVVSTPKQLDLNDNVENARNIGNKLKTSIREDATEFYNLLTKPIENASEFIARFNLAKKVYPTFYESFVRGRAQNYGVWVKEDYMNSYNFERELPVIGENEERYMDSLFLRKNYKDSIVDKSLGAYSSTLYNFLLVSSVQQMASLTKLTGSVNGGGEGAMGRNIKQHRAYINAKYLASVILYGNKKDDVKRFARSLYDIGLQQNGYHNDKKRHWYDMVACAAVFWLWCGPAAGIASPKTLPFQSAGKSDNRWLTNSYFNLEGIVKYGTYPILSDKNKLGIDQSNARIALIPNIDESFANGIKSNDYEDAKLWASALSNQAKNTTNDSWSWNAQTVWSKAEQTVNKVDGEENRKKGLSQARADLEYLSNAYFDKISKEWKEEMNKVKNGNDKIYFYGALSQGENSVIDLMQNDFLKSLFNVAMRKYWIELSSELRDAVIKIGGYKSKVDREWTTRLRYTDISKTHVSWLTTSQRFWGGDNYRGDELADLDRFVNKVYDGVKEHLSEKNRLSIFKKHLDEVWKNNKNAFETTIRNKLLQTKIDSQEKLNIATSIYKKYLIDAYNDENFKIIDPIIDNLNQKSIPSSVGGKTVNFAFIPMGNLGVSPDGVDSRGEDVLDRFLTKNIVLSILLEKESGIGSLLAERSIIVQREYVDSLFATLKTGIFPYLNTIFDEFSTQNHNLWDNYLELMDKGAKKKLSPHEANSYYAMFLAQKSNIFSKLLQTNIQSVSLAEGFLLDILEVPRFNDNTKTLQTIFEIIENSNELRGYLINTSSTLLSA